MKANMACIFMAELVTRGFEISMFRMVTVTVTYNNG